MGLEGNAFLTDLAQALQGKDLKAAGIRQNRAVPVHELMKSAELLDRLVAGPDMQMICIGKFYLCADLTKVLCGHGSLDRADSADVHENRCLDSAMHRLHMGAARSAITGDNLIHNLLRSFYTLKINIVIISYSKPSASADLYRSAAAAALAPGRQIIYTDCILLK